MPTKCGNMGRESTKRDLIAWEVIQLNLAALRKKKGLTQADLAAAIGVSTSAVGNWEAGLRRPRYESLLRLASVLGVTVDDLLAPPDQGGSKYAG
jgi:transcriptional regulator with XRE-family HTH domain